MSTIAEQNLRQIRDSMEVYCGMTARSNANLTFAVTGDVAVKDTNANTSLDTETWSMIRFADFQGDGFPLDGSCILKEATIEGSLENGKAGIRTDIGGTATVTIGNTTSVDIAALTIVVTSGTGTITANGVVYQARRSVIIPVNANRITLVIASDDEERRLEIASITPGVSIAFDNNNLVSVSLDLRSDLSIIGGDFPISAIEIQAYWPDDIAEAISNIADDVPIWYYAGYDGDYSPTRNFYLSEPASQTDGLLTIKGEDASSRLADADSVEIQRLDSSSQNGSKVLYEWFVKLIKQSGIKLDYRQKSPAVNTSASSGVRTMIMQGGNARDYIQEIMTIAHTHTFWPVFVDAGIPRITWSKPTSKWDIYEEDCGDVTQIVDRNLARLIADGDYGIYNTVVRENAWSTIQKDISIKENQQIIKNFSDSELYWAYQVSYRKNYVWRRINSVAWIPSKTSVQKTVTEKKKKVKKWFYRPTLYGKRLKVSIDSKKLVPASKRSGSTAKVSPLAIGKLYQSGILIYPRYDRLFELSNLSGSFTWKGNPKMQPRDVFTFHHLDGTTTVCTIESIELRHSEGGTTAEIVYREGIV